MQARPKIRVIGDPILHRKGKVFPNNPTASQLQKLRQQIDIAETMLVDTGGAGIAANQCLDIEDPFQFIIVGVDHKNPKHVANVKKRYPDTDFPQAILMINPREIYASEQSEHFFHGCLSVPGTLRGEIKTPSEIQVEFETLNEKNILVTKTETFKGIAAVPLKHEIIHILDGQTYIDRCYEALSQKDLLKLQAAFSQKKQAMEKPGYVPAEAKTPPEFYRFVTIGSDGQSSVDNTALQKALDTCIDQRTLEGLLQRLELIFKKKSDLPLFPPAPKPITSQLQNPTPKPPLQSRL